jgi:hypothetical protein
LLVLLIKSVETILIVRLSWVLKVLLRHWPEISLVLVETWCILNSGVLRLFVTLHEALGLLVFEKA